MGHSSFVLEDSGDASNTRPSRERASWRLAAGTRCRGCYIKEAKLSGDDSLGGGGEAGAGKYYVGRELAAIDSAGTWTSSVRNCTSAPHCSSPISIGALASVLQQLPMPPSVATALRALEPSQPCRSPCRHGAPRVRLPFCRLPPSEPMPRSPPSAHGHGGATRRPGVAASSLHLMYLTI